jgi:hypothetical protein
MKLKRFKLILFLSFILALTTSAQNTVGILKNTSNALNGYSLFTYQKETYLINNCGEVINQWTSQNSSGKSVYLIENGDLLRAAQTGNASNIEIAGSGGRIEKFSWDGTLLWTYDYDTGSAIQHHDIFPMPNGNILILAASKLTEDEALQMGRDPAKLALPTSGPTPFIKELYNEQILELQPVGSNAANIVWQWNLKDHLIQDFDNTKDNFGVVKDNPQLLDINYLGTSKGGKNWLHANSMQYNAQLDQIILSARQLNEFYIIDHSTTTAQAATNLGGTYGKGGDFLYRWGNPIAYGQGTINDQKLFGQHFPSWIPNGLPDAGKIILYNNGLGRTPSFSEILIITPPTNAPGVYSLTPNTAYGPSSPDYNYTSPINTDFYSPILSSAQRLPNGNTLICEGTSGYFFEIDTNENIVWEYINPIKPAAIMSQGDDPKSSQNNVFRIEKFPTDYVAFNGKDLTAGLPIELNPDLTQCAILSTKDFNFSHISIYPNPVKDILFVNTKTAITKIEIYNILGKLVKTSNNSDQINLNHLKSSLYFIKFYIDNIIITKKIIKSN